MVRSLRPEPDALAVIQPEAAPLRLLPGYFQPFTPPDPLDYCSAGEWIAELSGTFNSVRGELENVSIWEDDGDQVFDPTKDTEIASGLSATTTPADWGPVDLISDTNGPTDRVFAVGTFGDSDVVSPISDLATCPTYELDTSLVVTKVCRACLAVQSGALVVTVQSAGTISNTGDTPLSNVKVYDDRGTEDTSDDEVIDVGALAIGDTDITWMGTAYTPSSVNNTVPSLASFSDIVTATGEAPLGFPDAEAAAVEATCNLCVDEEDTTGIPCPPLE